MGAQTKQRSVAGQEFKPRLCQKKMVQTIIESPRCNIWAQPGMGKTAAVLSALDILWLCGSGYHPALVIAPIRVARDVWAPEARKWDCFSHIRVQPILGTVAQRKTALRAKADIYVINYENLQWLVEQTGKDWPFKIVIADEATKLKGFRLRKGAKRAVALARVSHKVGRWVNLTGTPATNGLLDLWGMNWFVDKGRRLGASFTAYKNRWFDEDQYKRTITPRPYARGQITSLVADVTCSLQAKDYFDLPALLVNNIYVTLPPDARATYAAVEEKMFAQLKDATLTAVSGAARTTKCLQLASGAVYTDDEHGAWQEVHTAKLEALKDLLEECAGEPLLCAYQYKHDLARILKAFPQARQLKETRDFADWNAQKIPLGLIHPASAGHGLNLAEGGRQIVWFSHWWDLEQYLQTVDRLGPTRQAQLGRTLPVTVHNLVARGTLDELALERRHTKGQLVDFLLKRLRR